MKSLHVVRFGLIALFTLPGFAQTPAPAASKAAPEPQDPIKEMVGRLDLERYKATIKGLTQFGDRRQGTDRNRAALDWIEAQLKSYGYTNTARLKYDFFPADPRRPSGPRPRGSDGAPGGGRLRGLRGPIGVNMDHSSQMLSLTNKEVNQLVCVN